MTFDTESVRKVYKPTLTFGQWPFGPWDVTKLGERVQDLIDPPGDVPEDSQTLRLIVNEGVGRSIFLGLQKRRRTGPMLMVLLEDLRVTRVSRLCGGCGAGQGVVT